MFKRYVSALVAALFIISFLPVSMVRKAYAYDGSKYFNDLKIGLVSMSAPTLTLTLNGEYNVNNQLYPSGTVFSISVSGTSITLNGTIYSQLSLSPSDPSSLLSITSGNVTLKYLGSFLIKNLNGKVFPINNIYIEDYLKGVVAYEMSESFPLEALKSQAVAARNYALSRIGYEATKGYDLDDTSAYQTYKGYNSNNVNSIKAVEATRGQVLLYNGNLVETLYSAWHGGYSENSENVWGNYVPYLRSVQDPYESDPWPNGNRIFTNAQMQSALVAKGSLSAAETFVQLDLNSITKYPSGRVSNINVIYKDANGVLATRSFTMDKCRTFLSLPSSMYTVTYDSVLGSYTFSGKGNGHGLGMSQIGAKNRAAAGQTFDQILPFYYQNSNLQNLIQKAAFSSITQSDSSIYLGNSINFNAAGAAGNGYGYLFKYVVKNGTDTLLTSDYSSNSSFNYSPSNVGTYTVEAYIKDKYSVSDFDDKRVLSFNAYNVPTLNSFTVDKTAALVGQTVNANAAMKDGSGAYLYKYEIAKDGALLSTSNYSSSGQYSLTPNTSGNYTITAYMKDSISTKDYDLMQTQSVTVYDNAVINSFNKDLQNVFTGNTVNFNVQTAGGSNQGISYRFVVIKDGSTILDSGSQTSNLFSYTPSASGNYTVQAYVKDTLSTQTYDDTKSLQFTVSDYPSLSSFTADKTQLLQNQQVNFTANASSGSGQYLYKFTVVKDGVQLLVSDYSSTNTYNYIPSAAGNYTVNAYIKDVLSGRDYDSMQSVTITVYAVPQAGTVTVNGYFYEGKGLSLSAGIIGGSPTGMNYKYEVYKSGILQTSSSFSTSNSFNYTPSSSGTYTVRVYVRDALSSNSYDNMKEFNITVSSKPLYISKLPLSLGMSGTDVTALQNALIKLGYSISSATGYFGTQTKSAVMSFQSSKGLYSDGIVGSMTYSALNDALIAKAGVKNLTY